MRRIIVSSLLVLLSFTVAVLAAADSRDQAVIRNWRQRLRTIDELLHESKWRRAEKMTNALLAQMCDQVESGEGAGAFLGMAALWRAVAEAGQGNEFDARWDFDIARTLQPGFDTVDLSPYGEEIAKMLALPADAVAGGEESPYGEEARTIDEDIEPPKRVHTERPKYPAAMRIACHEGTVVAQVIIEADGKPRRPRLLSDTHPVLGFATLDALRSWRFEPALLDGEPVEVYYNLTLNYRMPSCPGPLRD